MKLHNRYNHQDESVTLQLDTSTVQKFNDWSGWFVGGRLRGGSCNALIVYLTLDFCFAGTKGSSTVL